MKQKKHLKNLIKAFAFVLLVVLLLWGITRLMQPKYYFASQLKTPETELWNEFYALPKNDVEVLFLGASSVYCGVDAPEVGALTGRKVYTMASSSARMYDLYYMFQEALRFQKPDMLALFLLLLSDPDPKPLILMESPDEGLYHDMLDILASEMRNYSMRYPGCQIFFTTHNPYILENLSPSEIWVFSRGEKTWDDQIEIRCAGSIPIVQELYDQGVGMGAIWYAGHFDN